MKTNCGFCCRIYAQKKEEDEEQQEEEEGRATIARQSNCSNHKQQQVEEGPKYESKLGDLPENAQNFFRQFAAGTGGASTGPGTYI